MDRSHYFDLTRREIGREGGRGEREREEKRIIRFSKFDCNLRCL